jgi:serine/threonine-protein kinase HipA
LKREHFEQFAKGLGMTPKQIKGAFNRMVKNKSIAYDWIDRSFLSDSMKTAYPELLEGRYIHLGLLE